MEKIHLTLQDRQRIEQMLNTGKDFVEIDLGHVIECKAKAEFLTI